MRLRRAHLSWFTRAIALLVLGAQCDWCQQHPAPCTAPDATDVSIPTAASTGLQGFVDLHTHPMSNIGFAGKLVSGGVDEGSLLPVDPDCQPDKEAGTVQRALGMCGPTHDGNIDNPQNWCGDTLREGVIFALQLANKGSTPPPNSAGYPDFDDWPKWNDVTHQVMWVDWIRRAYAGGLRVMVAFAVNNKTLADVVQDGSKYDCLHPDDDKNSADQQILQLTAFVNRHSDFMRVATSADELKSIVQQNLLAVVLGLEVDNIGNFNDPNFLVNETTVHAEIQRLYGEGVRYLFPIHLIDNPFGTAAYYDDLFNVSTFLETHHFMNLECSQPGDQIDHIPDWCEPLNALAESLVDVSPKARLAQLVVKGLGMNGVSDSPICPGCGSVTTPDGPRTIGLLNRGVPYPGLTPLGKFAVLDMMRQGMLIDVDHMSQASVDDTLALALQEDYPVNSGHNNVREGGGSERNLAADAYAKIGQVHGMAGVGLAGFDQDRFIQKYQRVIANLNRPDAGPPSAGFGTDADGVSPLVTPPCSNVPRLVYDDAGDGDAGFLRSTLGNHTWDYNNDGVAHYGMLSDLVRDLPNSAGGADVQRNLMNGAQYFYDTWKKAEMYRDAHAGAEAGLVVAEQPIPPARAPNVCERPLVLDRWGRCVTPIAPAAVLRKEPPPEVTNAATILESGAYTLHLQTNREPGGPAPRVQDFAVELVAVGRALTLRDAAMDGRGGFATDHYFFMELQAGVQHLALVSLVSKEGKLDEVHGAFVASSAPGAVTARGSFRLMRVAATTGSQGPGASLDALESFLESLRD
jgi:microsomal dipeptidase-like Zn-dependent dipeptidase